MWLLTILSSLLIPSGHGSQKSRHGFVHTVSVPWSMWVKAMLTRHAMSTDRGVHPALPPHPLEI